MTNKFPPVNNLLLIPNLSKVNPNVRLHHFSEVNGRFEVGLLLFFLSII